MTDKEEYYFELRDRSDMEHPISCHDHCVALVDGGHRPGIKAWQVQALSVNPPYRAWGPGDDYLGFTPNREDGWDYMRPPSEPGQYCGWADGVIKETWEDVGMRPLDELNHVVHFYFQITPEDELQLVLWCIYPRKGASHGTLVKRLDEKGYKDALVFLHEAAQNNASRFSKVVALTCNPEKTFGGRRRWAF